MADVDLLLLGQVIDSGREAWSALAGNGIGIHHFEGRGNAIYEWVDNRLAAGGRFPTPAEVAERFELTWPREDGYTYGKLLEKVRGRRIARSMEAALEGVKNALARGDVARAEEIWSQTHAEANIERNGGIQLHSLAALGEAVLERYAQTKDESGPGLRTPWESVNRMLGKRVLPGSVLGLVARPSVGKTTLSLNIATVEWRIHGRTILYVTPEMNKVDLAESFFAFASRVSFKDMVMGKLSPEAEERLRETSRSLHDQSGLYVIDSDDGLTPSRIEAAIDRGKPDAVFIDSFYELFDDMPGHGDMLKRLDFTTKWMKDLAQSRRIPVVANSQLKQGVDASKAGDGSIGMSDRIMMRFQAIFKIWRNDPEDMQNGIVRIGPLKVRRAGEVKPEVRLQWQGSELVEMDPPRKFHDDSLF